MMEDFQEQYSKVCALQEGGWTKIWQVSKLIEASKDLPVFEANVDELVAQLENGTWFGRGRPATIGAVLQHMLRAMNVDLSYPIILASNGKLLDGAHRVIGAKVKGIRTVRAVQFVKNPPPDEMGPG